MEYQNHELPEEAKTALTEIEKHFIQLRSSGVSIRKIAKTLNKSSRTICKWNKKYYRNIVEMNSEEFKALRNKIVSFKTARLDFLIEEFKNVKAAMEKSNFLNKKNQWDYESYLELILKISKLVEKFENDLVVSNVSIQKIDESNLIDAESENIEVFSDDKSVVHDEKVPSNYNTEHIDNT